MTPLEVLSVAPHLLALTIVYVGTVLAPEELLVRDVSVCRCCRHVQPLDWLGMCWFCECAAKEIGA